MTHKLRARVTTARLALLRLARAAMVPALKVWRLVVRVERRSSAPLRMERSRVLLVTACTTNSLRARVAMVRLELLCLARAAMVPLGLLRATAAIVRPARLRQGMPMRPQRQRLRTHPLAITKSPPLLGEEHPTALFTRRRSLLRASMLISLQAMTMVRTTTNCRLQGRAPANSSRGPAISTNSCAD